jgi:site-specific DNA-cytosine methylase
LNQMSIFSLEEHPASLSQSQDSEKDWMTLVATSCSPILPLLTNIAPTGLVWENVPGVLSSNGGKDFGVFLGALGELGYGFAYRVLDAQYFGVAQRRRRVFVVGHLGDWRAAAAVLFERHSLQGHPAPSREKRQLWMRQQVILQCIKAARQYCNPLHSAVRCQTRKQMWT